MAETRRGIVGIAAWGGALATCILGISLSAMFAAGFGMELPAWLVPSLSMAATVAFIGSATAVANVLRRVDAASKALATDGTVRDKRHEPPGDLLSEAKNAREQISRYRLEVERLQDIDPVTGLGNRKWLQIRTAQELSRAQREETPLSFVLIAIDGYDEIAARMGSDASDALQLHIADTLKSFVRPYDAVARVSTSEFGVLMPGAAAPTSASIVQRLKDAIMARPPLLLGAEMPEIGVVAVERQPDERLFDELLGRARDVLAAARLGARSI